MDHEIKENYRCPLCINHQDDEFVWDELVGAYICWGCTYEIINGLDYPEQPTFDNYNCADTIERLLALLGVSYAELQQRWLALSKQKSPC